MCPVLTVGLAAALSAQTLRPYHGKMTLTFEHRPAAGLKMFFVSTFESESTVSFQSTEKNKTYTLIQPPVFNEVKLPSQMQPKHTFHVMFEPQRRCKVSCC